MSCPCCAVPCRANSHMPCHVPAVPCRAALIHTCRAVPLPCTCGPRSRPCPSWKSACSRKIPNFNRETPHGSRKKPNLGRSLTDRRETADVFFTYTIPCPWRAVPWPWEVASKAAWSEHGRGTAWYVWIAFMKVTLKQPATYSFSF